jgi:hypothetical protein
MLLSSGLFGYTMNRVGVIFSEMDVDKKMMK